MSPLKKKNAATPTADTHNSLLINRTKSVTLSNTTTLQIGKKYRMSINVFTKAEHVTKIICLYWYIKIKKLNSNNAKGRKLCKKLFMIHSWLTPFM